MGIDYYKVRMRNKIVAQHMELVDALTFVEALFQKYYLEPGLEITIIREDNEKEDTLEAEYEKTADVALYDVHA